MLLRSEFEAEAAEANKAIGIEKARNERFMQDKLKMGKSRRSDGLTKSTGPKKRSVKTKKELTVNVLRKIENRPQVTIWQSREEKMGPALVCCRQDQARCYRYR